MKLGKKLISSYLGISLLIGSIGITAMLYFFSLHSNFTKSHHQLDDHSSLISSLESELNRSMISLSALVRSSSNESLKEESDIPGTGYLRRQFLGQMKKAEQLADSLEQSVQVLCRGDFRSDQVQISRKVSLYASLGRQVSDLLEHSENEGATLYYTSLEPYFRNQILTSTEQLRARSKEMTALKNEEISERIQLSYWWMAGLTAMSVLLSVVIAIRIYGSIAEPLKALNETAGKFGQGKLDVRSDINGDDEIGELARSFNSMASSLKDSMYSRDYLRSILESVKEYMIVTDGSLRVSGCNKAASDIFGRSEEQLTGKLLTEFIDIEHLLRVKESDPRSSCIIDLYLPDGESIPVQLSYANLKSNLKDGDGFVFVLTDMRYRLMAEHTISKGEKQIEVLLSEVHHRVKNNLAVISGILHLQASFTQDDNAKLVLNESQSRIQSMAFIHELLYQNEGFSEIGIHEYLPGLINGLRQRFPVAASIEFDLKVQKCMVGLNEAVPLGLLINELILQLIHASGSGNDKIICVTQKQCTPHLEIAISLQGYDTQNGYILTSDTLGGLLVQTLLNQLEGELITDLQWDDIQLRIKIPYRSTADKEAVAPRLEYQV